MNVGIIVPYCIYSRAWHISRYQVNIYWMSARDRSHCWFWRVTWYWMFFGLLFWCHSKLDWGRDLGLGGDFLAPNLFLSNVSSYLFVFWCKLMEWQLFKCKPNARAVMKGKHCWEVSGDLGNIFIKQNLFRKVNLSEFCFFVVFFLYDWAYFPMQNFLW